MIKKSLYMLCTASILSASATMCYKKEHMDPSTIEKVALNGGECNGTLSVVDMKKNGYQIDSMKIQDGKDGFNYIYVFNKNTQNTMALANTSGIILTDAELTARLEKIQEAKKVKKVEKDKVSSVDNGKKIYDTTCKKCHGDGTIKAYNYTRALKTMTLEEMQISIRDISNGEQNNGMGILMQPYANMITAKEIVDIYNYLNQIK
ncbi:cytochrome c [Arcobacteraceae bacterium]|nr:cytochrome c [Arcobacteraceae bacterium]